jgi:PPOX class probable F420-dependent enzyme
MNDITPSAAIINRAGSRLTDALVIWMTTVSQQGQPQTSPIWHIVDGDELLMYSLESTRVRNVAANPRVALNLDGNGRGGAIVTLEGRARIVDDHPPCWAVPAYLEKYRDEIAAMNYTPRSFGEEYHKAVRIRLTAGRVW